MNTKLATSAHAVFAWLILIFGCFDALAQGAPNAPDNDKTQANGGVTSDKFILSTIDRIAECVNEAKNDASFGEMLQRLRVLRALIASLDVMLDSEGSGLKGTRSVANLRIRQQEHRDELKHAVDLYEQYVDSSKREKVDPAGILKMVALPPLAELRATVSEYRSTVDRAHAWEARSKTKAQD